MEIAPLATLLVALILLFEHGISGQVHPFKVENISPSKNTPSFRASQLSKLKTTIPAKSKLTSKASNRPITTTKRIGQTTKPIKKNQQLQKTTPKLKPQPRQLPTQFDWGPASVSLHPAEDNEDYGNLTSTELPDLYDDLTSTRTTPNTTEVPDAATVENVTRKRLKRRKTTTSDPTTSTKRRLKRTRTTTVGPEDA